MNDCTIIYPSYFRIFECRAGRWFIKNTEVFIASDEVKDDDIAASYGVTEQQAVINLFRINGGKAGFYLANFRDKKYHYCGQSREDVKAKLRSLGIGREDPMESS
ncbi:MAG: hypothetical protein RM049_26685 [Nostoc sp. DedQUE04]|uniref:hypothetical protein n=1 Tax=Nostoc sp. DedQUE04 TaxID=3075390 RepID=UPI002AD223A3|nr:hypothetical protein [Nostoc sp. DedQUE04]MDZ8138847.1 hypothetical protein [Nostoc sp. DedQUE04]